MTDQQLMTLCISLALSLIIPLSLLIYSNSRISEAKETLRAETKLLGVELRAEMNAGFARIEAAIERLETKLVIHELEHHHK